MGRRHHLAFLSIFPNMEGFSVVITKEHYPSYLFDLPGDVVQNPIRATRVVGTLLDDKLGDVGRTGLMFERFGVDHIHAKLFPMHGTKGDAWKRRSSNVRKCFERYEGYISSHDFERADDEVLAARAKKLRGL